MLTVAWRVLFQCPFRIFTLATVGLRILCDYCHWDNQGSGTETLRSLTRCMTWLRSSFNPEKLSEAAAPSVRSFFIKHPSLCPTALLTSQGPSEKKSYQRLSTHERYDPEKRTIPKGSKLAPPPFQNATETPKSERFGLSQLSSWWIVSSFRKP